MHVCKQHPQTRNDLRGSPWLVKRQIWATASNQTNETHTLLYDCSVQLHTCSDGFQHKSKKDTRLTDREGTLVYLLWRRHLWCQVWWHLSRTSYWNTAQPHTNPSSCLPGELSFYYYHYLMHSWNQHTQAWNNLRASPWLAKRHIWATVSMQTYKTYSRWYDCLSEPHACSDGLQP